MNQKGQKFLKKQPRQERAKETVEAILEAATYILIHEGLDGFNTNRVAEKAGVSIASLYQYFKDKNAILSELQRRHIEKTRKNLEQIGWHYKENSLEDLVNQLIESSIAAHIVEPDLHRIFGLTSIGGQTNEISSNDHFYLSGLNRALKFQGMNSNDADFTVWLFRTVVHASIHEGVCSYHEEIVSGRLANTLKAMLIDWIKQDVSSKRKRLD